MPVYGPFDEKSGIEGILKAQQNQEGDIDTVTVYLFLAKVQRLNFQNAKQRYNTIDLSPDYGTSASLRYIQRRQNQERNTIHRLLSRYTGLWQRIRCRFSLCLGFRGRMFFLVVAEKNPEQHKSTTRTK